LPTDPGRRPLAPEPYFLLAQLAQLRGDFAQAGGLLDKALYLDPGSVAAHLEMAALCERADNLPRPRPCGALPWTSSADCPATR